MPSDAKRLYNEYDPNADEPGLPFRESETHVLLKLHEKLCDGGIGDVDEEVLSWLEDELTFRSENATTKMDPDNISGYEGWDEDIER